MVGLGVRGLVALAVLVVAACGSASNPASAGPTAGPTGPTAGPAGPTVGSAGPTVGSAGPTEGVVEWQDYAPDVQSRIDELAQAKDCATLQEQFNIAVATQSDTLRRTGHNNAKLLGYINDALRNAGCYS